MQTLSYGPHPEQVADLRLPDAAPPDGRGHPVAVVLHGGFWRARYGREGGEAQAVDLAASGWATLNVEYRRLDLDGGWPTTGGDVLAALALLADRAAEDRLDLARIVPIGHSAGGQLALWAAAAGAGRPGAPTGAVSLGGVVDLDRAHALRLGDGVVERYLGGTPAERPDAYADASPRARLPLGVPTLLVHGGADDIVPASLSEDVAAAAVAAGDDVTLRVRPGDDHFVLTEPGSPAWAEVTGWLAERFA